MKSLRKSLNGHRDNHISNITSPLPSISKPVSAIQPPKKVIRALFSHKATAPQELSFEKGDFFHVLNDARQGQWYEAHNPVTGARGLVPVNMFEEFGKGGVSSPRSPRPQSARPESPGGKSQAFYAMVLYDFQAERADELDAKAGEAVTVVAQSNREWFVAKPIGKLGRPGLIPVSFVEIRDPSTGQPVVDVNYLIDTGALPRVEDWKKSIMSYKANSISLGVLDESGTPQTPSFGSAGTKLSTIPEPPSAQINVQSPSPLPQQHTPEFSQPPVQERPPSPNALPAGILLSAEVKSFHFEMDEYWFRVHATFQPYGEGHLPRAKQLILFRSYNDFYDFQVELLNAFPAEAGRENQERILPYMPGPVAQVDSEITVARREELDDYLHQLIQLRFNARYLLEHRLVREFLFLKPGDAEVDVDPCIAELEELDGFAAVEDQMARMGVTQDHDSGYAESGDASHGYEHDHHEHTHSHSSRPSMDHQHRVESTSSMYRKHSNASEQRNASHSRPGSRTSLAPRVDPFEHPRSNHNTLDTDTYRTNSQSRSSVASSHAPSPVRSSVATSNASGTSASTRSRSQSTANSPPISASIPQAAFIKIKVMHEKKNDLVAIRVHPRVTYAQLLEKVQTRLGDDSILLRYRDSLSNSLVELDNDADLRSWLDATERHMLYA